MDIGGVQADSWELGPVLGQLLESEGLLWGLCSGNEGRLTP